MMRRFLKAAEDPGPSLPKRARLDVDSGLPCVAEQHAFLDAGKTRNWALVKDLLRSHPLLINVQPLSRWSVLHQAAEAGNSEIVTMLLEQRGDVTLKTKDGQTALAVASNEKVRSLLASWHDQRGSGAGAEPSASTPDCLYFDDVPDGNKDVVPAAAFVKEIEGNNVAGEGEKAAQAVWQVQAAALPRMWTVIGDERQALFNDAKAAGIEKAMFRETGRSYMVDFDTLTQTDFTSGETRPIRLHNPLLTRSAAPMFPEAKCAFEGIPAARQTCDQVVATTHHVDKTQSGEPLLGETVDVAGSGSKPYTVKNCGNGVWSCTCIAWKMQGKKPTNQRSCKHIVSVRGAAAEDERVAAGVTTSGLGASGPVVATPLGRVTAVLASSSPDVAQIPPPLLLANKWEERIDPTGWWLSEKLDGMRAYWDPSRGSLLSRLGNPVLCPKPLLAGLPAVPLDGELFLGRGRFQELMSVVKNSANMGCVEGPWKDVVYTVFDLPKHGGKFEERMEALSRTLRSELPAGVHAFAKCHPQQLCKSRAHLDEELNHIQGQGGEGLMLRRPGSLYEARRSNTLLKVKTFQDEEAVVIGHELGKGRNSEVIGALRCRNKLNVEFSVGTGLSDAQRAHPPKVGEIITYRFFELTKDNKPRFPSFVGVRADADRTGLC